MSDINQPDGMISIIDEQCNIGSSELLRTITSSTRTTGMVYRSEYETARKVSMLISFLGWVVFAIGIITAVVGIAAGLRSSYVVRVFITNGFHGLFIAISGLFFVVAGQVAKATFNNSDHTREILSLLREKA